MRLTILATTILMAAAAGAAPPSRPAGTMPVVNPSEPLRKNCPATSRYEANKRGSALGLRKLNELPAADMYKSVYRRIDGCEVPIIAGYGIGGGSR